MEEAQRSRPSSFNAGIRHSSGSREDEKAALGILRPAIYCVAYFLCQLQLHHRSLLLLIAHHHHLLPPSLKFCLAHRHCPFLAQSSERKRERNTQEPVRIVWCPVRCVCQAFIPSRGPRDQEIQ